MSPGIWSAICAKRLSWEVTMEYGFNARLGARWKRWAAPAAVLDPAAAGRGRGPAGA